MTDREIELDQDANEYDFGSPSGESRQGSKRLLTPLERRLQLENPAYQMAHMARMAQFRETLNNQAMLLNLM